jgi:NCS1 family nucleobase:cation symporter-1
MVEKLSIQHVPEDARHGRAFSIFTLWLASNLTIADYALGSLLYGLPLSSIIEIITVGNLLGGLLLGISVSMGPRFGFPQMMISQALFGRLGNKPFALFNWVSTVGWYTINIILGSYALQILLHIDFIESAVALSIIQALLAIYGYDLIHGFERVIAVILGILFVGGIVSLYPEFSSRIPSYQTVTSFNPFLFAIVLAAVFSYLMSWAPYASDYSRYLHEKTDQRKLILYAMAGGAIASAIAELFGTMVYIVAADTRLNPIQAASSLGGPLAVASILAITLGALSANALNLYTNSLSAVTFYQKTSRLVAVLLAVFVGLLLAILGESNFGSFYEDFLLTLDYWITPWIGIMIAAFYMKVIAPEGVLTGAKVNGRAITAYLFGIAASVPFMNLTAYSVPFEGPVSTALGGADISYLFSFLVSILVFFLLHRRERMSNVELGERSVGSSTTKD